MYNNDSIDIVGKPQGGVKPLLSIVIPIFNEEKVVEAFHSRLSSVIDQLEVETEIIYVNDGSTDGCLRTLRLLRDSDRRIGILDFSRNFGKEAALTAGLHYASGQAVIIIDADLQDPPELIPEFLALWRQGADVVYGQRIQRKGDSFFKRATARAFYRFMQTLGSVTLPVDAGDFRLLSRRAVDALNRLREQHRFMKGLFTWIGYRQQAVSYKRDARYAGRTKWSYWMLWNFALEGITSFTIGPLKIATYIGLLTELGAFVFGLYIIGGTLLYGNPVAGYPSLMVVVLFLGGVQLITLGIIGEYLGRVFDETKRRPLYVLNAHFPPNESQARSANVDQVPNPDSNSW